MIVLLLSASIACTVLSGMTDSPLVGAASLAAALLLIGATVGVLASAC